MPFISQLLVKGIALKQRVGRGIWLCIRTPSKARSPLGYFYSDKATLRSMTRSGTTSRSHHSGIKTRMPLQAWGLKRRAGGVGGVGSVGRPTRWHSLTRFHRGPKPERAAPAINFTARRLSSPRPALEGDSERSAAIPSRSGRSGLGPSSLCKCF